MAVAVAEQVAVQAPLRRGPAVRLEGSLFGPDLLERLADGSLPGQKPKDFGLPQGRSLTDEVAAAYRDAKDQWSLFKRRLERLAEDDPATTITRDAWVIPFLGLLGYELRYNPRSYNAGGLLLGVSHRAGDADDAPPVHVVGIRRSLDRVDPAGRPRVSPHSLLQELLNRTDHLWGIVTNGAVLRLLRKSPLVRTQAYVEFDLETILEDDRFDEFSLLFRLLHRTRLPRGVADAGECWLERYYQDAREQGNRARERLRDGVEECLKLLGNGFLQRWRGDLPTAEELYAQLLRLVYRFLFLLVAEERGLLGGNDLYREHYSVSRFRRLVDRREAYTDHEDLWLSLVVLWRLLRDPTLTPQAGGRPLASLLGIPVLDGGLFEPLLLEQQTITNREFLEAFSHLVYYYDDDARTWRRINYAALDVEELGSVYESLLDNYPVVSGRTFDFAQGTERKSTGSYYTPAELVGELVRSALEPVLEERLRHARTKEEKERAILSIRVLDPACGSGHFLLAAARRLGLELARVRTGEEEPSPEARREATRDVIAHCIYAVDKNPLAVELCKVALWIEAQVPGKPLTFLDHRVRCGDSLLGVFDLEVLTQGIPDEAYAREDKGLRSLVRSLQERNRMERAGQPRLRVNTSLRDHVREAAMVRDELSRTPDDAPEVVQEKARRLTNAERALERERLACDLWTAAFFWELQPGKDAPTTDTVREALTGSASVNPRWLAEAQALAHRHRFFHWPLEFPEVFAERGFDVVLSNPPWERVKLQEQEFFATRDPEIARAPNKAARERLIWALPETNPDLWHEYLRALHAADSTSRFLRHSGRFPLTGRGDINTYAVFAELVRSLLKPAGRAGIIVPTGIATDATTQHFFRDLVGCGQLASLYDFENRNGLFPSVHRQYKFCLLTVAGRERVSAAEFAFFCHEVRDLQDSGRRFTMTAEDFRLLNPNTRTAPIFRSRQDAELTKHIYRRVPVLVEEGKGEAGNPWGVEFLRMFDMANDSALFRTKDELEAEGFRLEGNVFVRGAERYLPLYEAKMIHQFDHRFGDYAMQPPGSKDTQLPEVPLERLADPDYQVLPRYWVAEAEVEARLAARGWDRGWLLGWRDITNVTNERTVIAAVIPRVAVGHKYLLMLPTPPERAAVLVAVLDSLPFDYCARQKVGGTSLTYFTMKQLPVLPPEAFDRPCPWSPEETLGDWIRPRVLELTYTAWDLEPFARDLGYAGPPFRYDPERRALLRAELDACFFHLYLGSADDWAREATDELRRLFPTPRDAVAYVLDQFPIVKRRDEERYGEYRTARLVLDAYDRMAEAASSGTAYRSLLDPPPAHPRACSGRLFGAGSELTRGTNG